MRLLPLYREMAPAGLVRAALNEEAHCPFVSVMSMACSKYDGSESDTVLAAVCIFSSSPPTGEKVNVDNSRHQMATSTDKCGIQ